MEIKAKRIHKLSDKDSKVKGFMDITFNDIITVKGFKVVEGKSGLFVSMPSTKNTKNNRWYDDIRIEKKEDYAEFASKALALYEA